MKAVRLALVVVGLMTTGAMGDEPQIGDSVVVITDRAEVMAKQGALATVPMGTQFIVRQKSGSWLLGHFEVQGQNMFGWMRRSAVRVTRRKTTQQPVYQFTWHNLLLSRDKLDDEFTLEDYVDDYMKTSRQQVWERARYDEFQLERKRAETLSLVKKRVAEFDLDRDFMLRTSLTITSYDFESKSFPIDEASGDHYWYEYTDGSYPDSIPSQIKVYLVDAKMIEGIPMAPDKAERFLASRKSRSGSIDRDVHAHIRLRITGVRSSNELEAEVRWARIFNDKACTQLVYETPKSPLALTVEANVNTPDVSASQPVAVLVQQSDMSPQASRTPSIVEQAPKLTVAPSSDAPAQFVSPSVQTAPFYVNRNGCTACRNNRTVVQNQIQGVIQGAAIRQLRRFGF